MTRSKIFGADQTRLIALICFVVIAGSGPSNANEAAAPTQPSVAAVADGATPYGLRYSRRHCRPEVWHRHARANWRTTHQCRRFY